MRSVKVIIFILMIIVSNVLVAKEWSKSTPFSECPTFEIEKIEDGKKTHVRFRPNPNSTEFITYENITSAKEINNIYKDFEKSVILYCPSIDMEQGLQGLICKREDFDNGVPDEFTRFFNELLTHLHKVGQNSCEDVQEIIDLQMKIEALRDKDLLKYKSHPHILRLFAFGENQKRVKLFYKCGGKKNTAKFLENLIMIEMKNECLFPRPPGNITYEQAKEIATNTAKDYSKTGLLGIALVKKNEMTRKLAKQVVHSALKNEFVEKLGTDYDYESKIKELDFVKRIDQKEKGSLTNKLTYVTAIDAPLEVVDKLVPDLIYENVKDKISGTNNRQYIDTMITPNVIAKYNKCINPFKLKIGYNQNLTAKEIVKKRLRIKKQFCKKNPDQCNALACQAKVNYFSDDPSISDMDVIQGCLMQGLRDVFEPVLNKIIDSSASDLASMFDPPKTDLAPKIKSEALTDLNQCLDSKISKENGTPTTIDYYRLNPDNFEKYINECSAIVETKIFKNAAALVLASKQASLDLVGEISNAKLDIYGTSTPIEAKTYSDKVIDDHSKKCLDSQNINIKKYEKQNRRKQATLSSSITNCSPLIELEVTKNVINQQIKSKLASTSIDQKTRDDVQNSFNQCIAKEKQKYNESLFNPNVKNPVFSADDTKSFIDKSGGLFNCTKSVFNKIVPLIANEEIDKKIQQILSEQQGLSDPDYVRNMKSDLTNFASECFNEQVNKHKNWKAFADFIDKKDGINNIQKTCESKATTYALPKVASNETIKKIEEVASSGLIDSSEKDEVINKLTLKISKDFNINLNSLPEPKLENAFRESFKIHESTSSSKQSMDEYINEITSTGQLVALGTIKNVLLDHFLKENRTQYDFKGIKNVITDKCINDLYGKYENDLNSLIEQVKNAPIDPKSKKVPTKKIFVDILTDGLVIAKKRNNYDILLSKIDHLCKNRDKLTDLSDLVKTGIADQFILGQIIQTAKPTFFENMEEQCLAAVDDEINSTSKIKIMNELCSESIQGKDIEKLVKQYNITAKEKIKLRFILERKANSNKLIEEYFSDPKMLASAFLDDKEVFSNIYANFDKVILGEKETGKKLEDLVKTKIFKDASKDSFASKFSEVQIVAGIGISGFNQALDAAEKQVKGLPFYQKIITNEDRVMHHTKVAIGKHWRYDSIKDYLGLDQTESSIRQDLTQSLVNLNILEPSSDNENKFEQILNQHLETYKNHKNPDYKKKKTYLHNGSFYEYETGGPKHFTFIEKMSYEIEEDATKAIIDELF